MRAAFFDLDGCLVDSREPITGAVNAALEALGLARQPVDDLLHFIGPPLHGSFEVLLADLGADAGLAEDAVDAYREAYPELSLTQTRLMPGMLDLLGELSDTMAVLVVTSKPVEFAGPITETLGIRPLVREVFGPPLTALTEPKAACLERAIDLVGVTADERRDTAMVGDRRHDIIAGLACGTSTVGVTWGIGDRTELEEAGADVVVDQVDELRLTLQRAG